MHFKVAVINKPRAEHFKKFFLIFWKEVISEEYTFWKLCHLGNSKSNYQNSQALKCENSSSLGYVLCAAQKQRTKHIALYEMMPSLYK
jgi:hypothetical protein